MIRFLGKTPDGKQQVSVSDYSRKELGELSFTFRDIEDSESLSQYFDRIMNKYWHKTGKNKRRYHED